MKKFILLFLFSSFGTVYAQTWTWGIKATGTSQDYNAIDLNVDADGNMVLAGYYRLNFNFGNFSISSKDDYYRDIFLAKINSNKEVLWLKNIEAGSNYGNKIALKTDDDGNIFLTSSTDEESGIIKYDSNGNKIWFNGDTAGASSISFDQEENIYVAGGAGWSFFIAKLNKAGETVWKKWKSYNYSDAISISDIEADRFGNVYFTGYFAINSLKLDDNITLTNSSSNDRWCLFGKMDTNGNFIWAKNFQGSVGNAPKLSLNKENEIIITGSYYINLKFDDQTLISGFCCADYDAFLSKFDKNGNKKWLKRGTSVLVPNSSPIDSKVDFAGNIYLTGSFYGSTGFEEGGGYKNYVEKYDKDGSPLWRKNNTYNSNNYTKSIDIDNLGNVYYAGYNTYENFINHSVYSPPLSAGIAQLNTAATTFNKIKKPVVNGNTVICGNENSLSLSATGENIKWYSDSQLTNLIGSNNAIEIEYSTNTKLFVTQTINNIESWPRVIDIKKSDLSVEKADLQYNLPSLSVINNADYEYQWFYNNQEITNANTYYIDVQNGNNYLNYSVLITHGNCSLMVDSNILGLNEVLNREFNIYPNPSSEYFKIVHPKDFTIISLDIVDISGKVVKKFKEIEKYYIANIPKGKYFVRIKFMNKQPDKIISFIKK